MKNVLLSMAVLLGAMSSVQAGDHPRNSAAPECVCVRCNCSHCHCDRPVVVERRYVGRGVLNYSAGVGSRMWGGIKIFFGAPFKEPFEVPRRQYLVTPGHYHYHPGSVREIVPGPPVHEHGHHHEPRVELGRPEHPRR